VRANRTAMLATTIGVRAVQAIALVLRVVVAVWLAERHGIAGVVLAAAAVGVLAALRLTVVAKAGSTAGTGGSPNASGRTAPGLRLAAAAWLAGVGAAAVWAAFGAGAPGMAVVFAGSEVLAGVAMVMARPLRQGAGGRVRPSR
jgi:hypothetical protein